MFTYGVEGRFMTTVGNNESMISYLITDQLGSMRVAMAGDPDDSTTEVRQYINNHPFGILAQSGGNYQADFRYTGHEYDAHGTFKFHYMGARYYDDRTGQFTGIDKAGEFASGYNYVGNDPIMRWDPDGNDARPYFHDHINPDGDGTAHVTILTPSQKEKRKKKSKRQHWSSGREGLDAMGLSPEEAYMSLLGGEDPGHAPEDLESFLDYYDGLVEEAERKNAAADAKVKKDAQYLLDAAKRSVATSQIKAALNPYSMNPTWTNSDAVYPGLVGNGAQWMPGASRLEGIGLTVGYAFYSGKGGGISITVHTDGIFITGEVGKGIGTKGLSASPVFGSMSEGLGTNMTAIVGAGTSYGVSVNTHFESGDISVSPMIGQGTQFSSSVTYTVSAEDLIELAF